MNNRKLYIKEKRVRKLTLFFIFNMFNVLIINVVIELSVVY